MALSPGVYDAILAKLRAARPVEGRKMFGGAGLYLDGVFFAVVDDDRLFLKVDETTLPRFEGCAPWMQGDAVKPYRELPDGLLDDPARLGPWLDEARDVAVRKKR